MPPTAPVRPAIRPAQSTPARPAPPAPAASAAPVATSAHTAASVATPPPTSAAPANTGTPAASRAPINPFLANDPNAKARRLARALVSDLVTYFPQRRDEGLRDGTLRELFRDEIKKSQEEYVEQVGRDFAETTTHFQDALNDILAGGQRIF